ncbi:hypothetical protein [Neobacillus sp. D3-1R]|uniref:hypothetical protein n=1 Tax=Neobacillus sp. D3-1R TaxID=3445778 RepID=UPI003FA09603
MSDKLLSLEKRLEESLILYEQTGKYDMALEQYKQVETDVCKMIEHKMVPTNEAYKLLAQCYLRQAGMLRQLGRIEEANVINKKEIESARLSDSTIAYAQSLFSTGINLLSNRQMEEGLSLLNEAKKSFEDGDTYDHKQGVGWYWIILADLGNKGLIKVDPDEIIKYANHAIEILTPIQNLPGISRANEASSIAYKNKEDDEKTREEFKKFIQD